MKKAIFSLVALCLIGMCSAYAVSLPGTPIVFVDIYGIMPCDDGQNDNAGGRPDPTRVVGGIDGLCRCIGAGYESMGICLCGVCVKGFQNSGRFGGTMCFCNIIDQLLNNNGFTNTRTTKQTNFSTFKIRT